MWHGSQTQSKHFPIGTPEPIKINNVPPTIAAIVEIYRTDNASLLPSVKLIEAISWRYGTQAKGKRNAAQAK